MKRFHQRSPYRVTLNHAFGEVIEGCASDRDEGTDNQQYRSRLSPAA